MGPRRGHHRPRHVARSLDEIYWDEVKSGFKPGWVCRTDKEFIETFAPRFDQPLLLAGLPTGTKALGIAYTNVLSPRTVYVLVTIDRENADRAKLLVFVDRASEDPSPTIDPHPRLHLFRRQLDDLVLYELTPLDQPSVLEYFVVPEQE